LAQWLDYGYVIAKRAYPRRPFWVLKLTSTRARSEHAKRRDCSTLRCAVQSLHFQSGPSSSALILNLSRPDCCQMRSKSGGMRRVWSEPISARRSFRLSVASTDVAEDNDAATPCSFPQPRPRFGTSAAFKRPAPNSLRLTSYKSARTPAGMSTLNSRYSLINEAPSTTARR